MAKTRTKDNIIDDLAISYISHLLKTEEQVVEKITDEKSDIILVIEQASKKRLNKKRLLDLHPKLSSLLMVFREGIKAGLDTKQCEFLAEAFYKYFFCLKNIKNIEFDTEKASCSGAQLCLILIVFFEDAIRKFCDSDPEVDSYPDARAKYVGYIKKGLRLCKTDLHLNKSIEVLTTIKEKYL